MSYQILSLKWRPKKFSEIVGQKHISQALSNAIKLDRVAHAFTFSGPRGVGKTSTARILSQELNNVDNINNSIDIIEMDAASNRGIDEIRNLRESVQYAPSNGKYKIYIIDEAHMLTKEAFNALLKTLEEPPNYVIFILATTELYKMPETIVSRTQRYDFRRLTIEDIYCQMKYILKEEKIEFDEDSLYKIADKADGSMRDALSILDQMICVCDNNIEINKVMSVLGIIDDKNYYNILELVGKRESGDILKIFNNILTSGVSIDNFIEGFARFINSMILANAISDSKYSEFNKNYNVKDLELSELDLLRLLDICIKFQSSLKQIHHPKIAVENLLLKFSYFDNSIDIKKYLNNSKHERSNLEKKTEIKSEKGFEKEDIGKLSNVSSIVKENIKEISSDVINEGVKKTSKVVKPNDNQIQTVTKQKLYDNWDNILSSIDQANIMHALEKIEIANIDEKQIDIIVLDINQFMYKNILKEIQLINAKINKYFNINVKLDIAFKESDKEVDNKNKDKSSVHDKDNPLFMDAMNKFKGEILR